MKAKEAYELVMDRYKGTEAISCHEYESVFVFAIVPEKLKDKISKSEMLDGLYSVNKRTKEVRPFLPLHISVSEYRNGKEIKDFK